MALISVTRLRLRALRFLPAFARDMVRTNNQVRGAAGFVTGAVLADLPLTFWTLTAWDSTPSMRGYMTTGAHRLAMPRLLDWCDESAVADWEQAEAVLPGWQQADAWLRERGRPSRVSHPSPDHAAMTFRPPRTLLAAPVARAR